MGYNKENLYQILLVDACSRLEGTNSLEDL